MGCWNREADKRPTFKMLNQLLKEEKRQINEQSQSPLSQLQAAGNNQTTGYNNTVTSSVHV